MQDYKYNVLLTDQITGGVGQSQVFAVSINIMFNINIKQAVCDSKK